MHQQFKIQQLFGFYNLDEKFLQRGTDWVFKAACHSSLDG
jgi:hypothetical protein